MSFLKKPFNILLVSIFELLVILSYAEAKDVNKQFYIIGGGGEAAGDRTLFDDSLEKLGLFTNDSNWNTSISFNGGHEYTETIIKNNIKAAKNFGPFTAVNYNKVIDDMIMKLGSKDFNKNDQMMLTIDTHGAKPSASELAHSIALSDKDGAVNLDRLKVLIKLAAKKKVKLGIIDLSCYSGALQKLNNGKACLISGTGTEHYSYGEFAISLFSKFKTGKNLEEIFLETRSEMTKPSFPMISTPEGKEANEIYNLLTPFLNYNTATIKDFSSNYHLESDPKFYQDVCLTAQRFNNLLSVVDKIEASDKAARSLLTSELKAAINKYRQFQKKYENALLAKAELGKTLTAFLSKEFPEHKNRWGRYSSVDWLGMDYPKQINEVHKIFSRARDSMSFKIEKDMINDLLVDEKIALKAKAKLPPHLIMKINEYNYVMEEAKDTMKYATAVSAEARTLYDAIYKSKMTKKSNPCRDFTL